MMMNKKEKRHKEYLALERERTEIWTKIRNLPLIPYEKPIQNGWTINFELRSDIAKRDDAQYIKLALSVGYKPAYLKNIKHIQMMRSGKKGYWTTYQKRRVWTPFSPYVVWLKDFEYEKLHPAIKKYFYRPIFGWWDFPRYRDRYRIVMPEFWLIAKPRPYYLTHYRNVDGKLESRLAWINMKLENYPEFRTNYGRSYPAHKDRTRIRAAISGFKKGEVPDIINEKVPMEYYY